MKKTITVILFLWVFIISAGCGTLPRTISKGVLDYKSIKHGFSLTFPQSWEGKYFVTENGRELSVSHKTDLKRDANFFTIYIFNTKDEWEKFDKVFGPDIGLKKIYEKDSTVFVITYPTDYPYGIDDDAKYAQEFEKMKQDIPEIEKSFTCINKRY